MVKVRAWWEKRRMKRREYEQHLDDVISGMDRISVAASRLTQAAEAATERRMGAMPAIVPDSSSDEPHHA